MPWQLICDDSFPGANTTVGAAGSTTGVPTTGGTSSPWTDAGGIWNIVSNKLHGVTANLSGFLTNLLYRPLSTESFVDQRIVVTYPAGVLGTPNIALGILLRVQSPSGGNQDHAIIQPDSTKVIGYAITGGSVGSLLLPSPATGSQILWTGTYDATHRYSVECFTTSASGAQLAITINVTDLTTGTLVASGSLTGYKVSLQGAGTYGVSLWSGSGTVTANIERIQTYKLVAGPTPGTLTSGAVTSTTAALSTSTTTGGTSPYTNQLQRSPTGANTWSNVGTSAIGATFSITDTGLTSATVYDYRVAITDAVPVTVYTNTVTITTGSASGPTAGTLVPGSPTTTSVSLNYGTTTGGTSPYSNQLQRSPSGANAFANVLTAVTGPTATFSDTGLTPSTSYDYRLLITATGGATATSNTVTVTTASAAATSLVLTNPTPNITTVGTALTLTLQPNGSYAGTPAWSDNGGGGTFGTAPSWAGDSAARTITYSNATSGTYRISVTASGLTSPADRTEIVEKALNVVCVGDSLTYGSYTSTNPGGTTGTSYPAVMKTILGSTFPLVTVANEGSPGQQMDAMRFARVWAPAYNASAGFVNIAIVMGGHNDIYLLLNAGNSIAVTASTVITRLTALVADIKAVGYKVIVFTLASAGGYPSGWEEVRQLYNGWTRKNWQTIADGIIDLGSDSRMGWAGTYSNRTYFYTDDTHYTDAGYKILGEYAGMAVRQVLLTPASSGGGGGGTGFSFAAFQAEMDSRGLTAGTMAKIDAPITSRSTYAGTDTAGTTALLGRVTGPVALASQIPANFTSDTFASPGVFSQSALANAPVSNVVGGGGGNVATDSQGRVFLAPAGLDAVAVEPGINARQALSPILAGAAGLVAGAGLGAITVAAAAPGSVSTSSSPRIVSTMDRFGNRTNVVLTIPT